MPTVRLREAITECLADALSDSVDVQQKALQKLDSITKVSPQNRNVLAQTEGAVSTLLALTNSPSTVVHNLSLSVLFNLSLNPDLKKTLASMETITSLNTMILSSRSPESSRLASSLVCSLAMLDKNKAKFGVAGTIQVLVAAILEPTGSAAHHILSSLAELSQFHGNCTVAVRSGAVEALLEMVESTGGEDLAGTSLAVLCLLSRFDEGLNVLIKRENVVSVMVDVMKGRCMIGKEGAAELLWRLLDESEGCVRDAQRILPELLAVLADLSVRGSSGAREKAGALMKKMMDANNSHADASPLFLQWTSEY